MPGRGGVGGVGILHEVTKVADINIFPHGPRMAQMKKTPLHVRNPADFGGGGCNHVGHNLPGAVGARREAHRGQMGHLRLRGDREGQVIVMLLYSYYGGP